MGAVTTGREGEVVRAFVALASSLAGGYDPVDLLGELTRDCTRLLDVTAAGLLLADSDGVLHVLAASSEQLRLLEVFQLQRAEGPCLDCYRTGAPVTEVDLDGEERRWPVFAPAAREAGFASVHALPMRLQGRTLGTLGLFGAEVGALGPDDLVLGQALADVASVALVQSQVAADSATVNDQLQRALTSRVVLEQAKGVLAESGGMEMTDAFMALRSYARDRGEKLTDVARAVVSRSLPAGRVLEHATTRAGRWR